jgi:hypothetical protein
MHSCNLFLPIENRIEPYIDVTAKKAFLQVIGQIDTRFGSTITRVLICSDKLSQHPNLAWHKRGQSLSFKPVAPAFRSHLQPSSSSWLVKAAYQVGVNQRPFSGNKRIYCHQHSSLDADKVPISKETHIVERSVAREDGRPG